MTERDTVNIFLSYFYNHTKKEVVEAIFPGRHPDYIAEKLEYLAISIPRFWAALDISNQIKLVELANAYHRGEDA